VEDTRAEEFAELAISLHDEPTVADTVDRVLEFARRAVDCTYAGVIFVHRGRDVETFAATDPLVARLDQIQVEVGQGPDLEIIEDHHGVIVSDTRTDPRWPEWARVVADTGVRSMAGARLHTSSETIGSLNVYDERPGRFDRDDLAVVHVLARHAAVALAATRETGQLWQAIDARQLIGQATGILMERFSLDGDRAFEVLRRYSQDRNVKLRDVAARLVETRRLPE
jgi:GAF domain-containing protein